MTLDSERKYRETNVDQLKESQGASWVLHQLAPTLMFRTMDSLSDIIRVETLNICSRIRKVNGRIYRKISHATLLSATVHTNRYLTFRFPFFAFLFFIFQTEINRRTVALYNDFRNCLSEISVEMADLCKTLSALDSACVKATGSRVGSHVSVKVDSNFLCSRSRRREEDTYSNLRTRDASLHLF